MINKDNLSVVWFPNKYEIQEHLKKFNKPMVLPKEIEETILYHYNKAINNLKVIKLETTCPNCNSELKEQSFNNGPFNEEYSRYVCPLFPKCNGHIMNKWNYDIASKGGYKIHKINFPPGWLDRLEEEFKTRKQKVSRATIYKLLKQKNLDSPTKIERELIKKYEGRDSKIGCGYKTANENSKKQEIETKEKLVEIFGWDNIKYQQWVFYRLKNDTKTYHKVIDFLVFDEDRIIIIECKLSEWNKKEEQEKDYITLMEFMNPNKQILFKYEIKEEKWF